MLLINFYYSKIIILYKNQNYYNNEYIMNTYLYRILIKIKI